MESRIKGRFVVIFNYEIDVNKFYILLIQKNDESVNIHDSYDIWIIVRNK